MRRAIVRSVTEALREVERCAELVGDNQAAQALLDSAGDKLRRAVREVERALSPLNPLVVHGQDLHESLTRLAGYAQKAFGVALESYIDEAVAGALPPSQAGHVLQVVHEGLANAILHAGASRVALRATVEGRRLVIRLSDDGRGFDVRAVRLRGEGGLATMQRRTEDVGGMLSVVSAPAAGTIVTLTVPLPS